MSPSGDVPLRPYPGRLVELSEADPAIITAVQRRLNELGCGPIDENGVFDARVEDAVKLFQARFADADGLPLKMDGIVGPITWAALFGADSVPITTGAAEPLLAETLDVAVSQLGVLEVPPGSNRGPQVDQYVLSVGLNPADANPWCAAFVYFCFNEAAGKLSRPNPVIRTGSVMEHWDLAAARGVSRVLQQNAFANPALVKPGQIFILATGGGHGHTGVVEEVTAGKLVTIEGNTNPGGSPEGIGVFRRSSRKIVDINRGFIDYSGR